MNLFTILLIVLIVILLGGGQFYGGGAYRGYSFGGVGLLVLILVLFILFGR
jgi:hypothetical protein